MVTVDEGSRFWAKVLSDLLNRSFEGGAAPRSARRQAEGNED